MAETAPSLSAASSVKKRSGGRSGFLARRGETGRKPFDATVFRRKVKPYDLVNEDVLVEIEHHADWILKEVGLEIHEDTEALHLFKKAGADVVGSRVRFDPGLVQSLCKSAPSQFVMHARDPAYSITLGGDHIVLSPAYGPPFVRDREAGRRYATIDDFRNIVKLTHASPWLNHSGGTVCEPVDLPVNKRHLDMVYAHFKHSSKPFMGSVTSPERAEDSIAMARLVFSDSFMAEHCVIQGNINTNSPLVFDGVMTGALKAYARANQGVVISPFILGGAMGPVTQPALLAQAHAETMAGVALAQLVRKGTPVVYGNFLTTMNLKTGAPTFGTPEANLSTFAIAQLCRRLGLPLRCGGHLTAAKVADGQAMQESATSMMSGIMAGSNLILHAAGWLEGGLTFGYEKFVMDLDHCGMMLTMVAGLSVNENTLAAEAYREAGPGGDYLGSLHTLKNFETANYMSDMADTSSFEQWSENGSRDAEQRASVRCKEMLTKACAPGLDAAIDEALQDFVSRRKAEMDDEWH